MNYLSYPGARHGLLPLTERSRICHYPSWAALKRMFLLWTVAHQSELSNFSDYVLVITVFNIESPPSRPKITTEFSFLQSYSPLQEWRIWRRKHLWLWTIFSAVVMKCWFIFEAQWIIYHILVMTYCSTKLNQHIGLTRLSLIECFVIETNQFDVSTRCQVREKSWKGCWTKMCWRSLGATRVSHVFRVLDVSPLNVVAPNSGLGCSPYWPMMETVTGKKGTAKYLYNTSRSRVIRFIIRERTGTVDRTDSVMDLKEKYSRSLIMQIQKFLASISWWCSILGREPPPFLQLVNTTLLEK